jgi:hypothetical protein
MPGEGTQPMIRIYIYEKTYICICIKEDMFTFIHPYLFTGDTSQPMIRIRGNRCYLCKYDLEENTLGHAQMRELGMTNTTDLYEMAGCLLR